MSYEYKAEDFPLNIEGLEVGYIDLVIRYDVEFGEPERINCPPEHAEPAGDDDIEINEILILGTDENGNPVTKTAPDFIANQAVIYFSGKGFRQLLDHAYDASQWDA